MIKEHKTLFVSEADAADVAIHFGCGETRVWRGSRSGWWSQPVDFDEETLIMADKIFPGIDIKVTR